MSRAGQIYCLALALLGNIINHLDKNDLLEALKKTDP